MRLRLLVLCLAAVSIANIVRADALERLKPEKLAAVRAAIEKLRTQRRELPRSGPYREYRANLHVHSAFSHDSRGTIDEIVAAAKAVGTRIVMFTEHPADSYDYVTDGHQGMKDGVLLIPGAETQGFLAYPTRSMRGLDFSSPQEFVDLVRRNGGLLFLSHLEERMMWEIRGLTGTEIYNTHADFKDEKEMQSALRNPLWVWNSLDVFREYPQEAFSALQDYPKDYLKRWDTLCRKTPHTGVAANDAHQNVGLVIRLADGGKARFEDALGKKLIELNADAIPSIRPLLKDKKVGDILAQHRLDPYENSLRHVGTHLLMKELSTNAVWEALEAGRAFVAFDWIADATSFDFAAYSADRRHEMGSRVSIDGGLRLKAQAPLTGRFKLIRDGEVIKEIAGDECAIPVEQPGIYRVEVWLDVAGEPKIWILSNPIYCNRPTER